MHGRFQPKGVCARCGFEYPLSSLRKEWTGLRVCADDYDPRPAEMRAPRYKPEGLILPDASPEPAPVFGRITWDGPSSGGGVGQEPEPEETNWSLILLLMDDFSL